MDTKLSIVIISMNNVNDLIKCIDSLSEHHDVSKYEIWLVAFNFSIENLALIKNRFSYLKIIESKGVIGFAENNNLALKKITGKYCLVLNDDTLFKDSSIDKMIELLDKEHSISIVSPFIKNFDGSTQVLGRPKFNIYTYILYELKLMGFLSVGDTSKELFKTYNLMGACFIIRTEVFKKLGFFDERYFFTPEDIALSKKASMLGYDTYVYKPSVVFHKGSSTAKKIHNITIPVAKQGWYLYYREFYGFAGEYFVRITGFIISFHKLIYWMAFKKRSQRKEIMMSALKRSIIYSFKDFEPKSLFLHLLQKN